MMRVQGSKDLFVKLKQVEDGVRVVADSQINSEERGMV